jgi:hypothetical protein
MARADSIVFATSGAVGSSVAPLFRVASDLATSMVCSCLNDLRVARLSYPTMN